MTPMDDLIARLEGVAEDCAEQANRGRMSLRYTADQEHLRNAYVTLREAAAALRALAQKDQDNG